ncbi:MAG: TolC family protein [Spirochaetes bacterium]|nr:TolC family protein [Spirochaetota bacterium]
MRFFKYTGFFILFFLLSPLIYGLTLDLKGAIETGLKHNRSLQLARERVKAAQAEVGMARSSFYPTIEGSLNYTYMGVIPTAEMMAMGLVMPDPTDPFYHYHTLESAKLEMARRHNWGGGVTVTQPLFMWGRLINAYNLASMNLEAEEQNFKKQQIQTIYDIKEAFYSYLVSIKRVALLEDQYQQLEENVKSAKINYGSGLFSKYDLMDMEVRLANMEPALKQAKDGLQLAMDRLKTTLGYDKDDLQIKDELEYTKIDLDFTKTRQVFLQKNPDLISARLGKRISEKSLSLSRAANKPTLMGIFDYNYTYIPEGSETFGSSEPHSWTVTVALSIPISEWLPWSKTSRDIDKSKALLNQADLGYEQLKDSLQIQLKQIILDLGAQYQLIESQKQNVEKARQTYEFRKKQYKSGLIRNTDLLGSQVALKDAETNYLNTAFNYIMAKARLDLLLGNVNKEKF